jgi:hypothetical protein
MRDEDSPFCFIPHPSSLIPFRVTVDAGALAGAGGFFICKLDSACSYYF